MTNSAQTDAGKSMYGDDIPRATIREVYPAVFPTLERYAAMLPGLVGQFCSNHGIKIQTIEARAKEVDSLIDKFGRHPDYQWLSDSEDLCGVRIITFYLEDVEGLPYLTGVPSIRPLRAVRLEPACRPLRGPGRHPARGHLP